MGYKDLVFDDAGRLRILPAAPAHVDGAIKLLKAVEAQDQHDRRHKRLGPASEAYLLAAIEEYSGLSTVAVDDQDEVVGCAFVSDFVAELGRHAAVGDRLCVEAAKMAVSKPLRSTGLADLLHAIRIVETVVNELTDPHGSPMLVYNVLEKNEAQLAHVRRIGLVELDLANASSTLRDVLDDRVRRLDLDGQAIRSFKLSDQALRTAINTLFTAIRNRVILRPRWQEEGKAGAVCWKLDLAGHPACGSKLFRVLDLCEAKCIQVPAHIRDLDRDNPISYYGSGRSAPRRRPR